MVYLALHKTLPSIILHFIVQHYVREAIVSIAGVVTVQIKYRSASFNLLPEE